MREDTYPCPKNCSDTKTNHLFLKEKGDYNEIYEVKCLKCEHVHEVHRHAWLSSQIKDDTRPRRAYLDKYPRIEPHTGEWVNSKEEARAVASRLGFHEAKHGVDERYNNQEKQWIGFDRPERSWDDD